MLNRVDVAWDRLKVIEIESHIAHVAHIITSLHYDG